MVYILFILSWEFIIVGEKKLLIRHIAQNTGLGLDSVISILIQSNMTHQICFTCFFWHYKVLKVQCTQILSLKQKKMLNLNFNFKVYFEVQIAWLQVLRSLGVIPSNLNLFQFHRLIYNFYFYLKLTIMSNIVIKMIKSHDMDDRNTNPADKNKPNVHSFAKFTLCDFFIDSHAKCDFDSIHALQISDLTPYLLAWKV